MSEVSSYYTNKDLMNKYGVESTSSSSSTTASSSSENKPIEDTFMELLLAELKHQNPMEPMDSSQMVSQMAQMNTVEQLKSMAESMKAVDKSNNFLTASSLIGKQVAYLNEEVYGEGIVSSFTVDNNTVKLLINDQSISLNDVIGVSEVQEAAEEEASEETDQTSNQETTEA